MSRFSARRTLAGFVLAALLASAPARAGGFPEPALHWQDLWSRAWSWVTDLWMPNRGDAATPRPLEKDQPPGPPPHKDPPTPPPWTRGDQGSGIDPDG